jgi:hypothetical protein
MQMFKATFAITLADQQNLTVDHSDTLNSNTARFQLLSPPAILAKGHKVTQWKFRATSVEIPIHRKRGLYVAKANSIPLITEFFLCQSARTYNEGTREGFICTETVSQPTYHHGIKKLRVKRSPPHIQNKQEGGYCSLKRRDYLQSDHPVRVDYAAEQFV